MENWVAKYLINTEAVLNIGELALEKCTYKIRSIEGLEFFKPIQDNPHFRLIEIVFAKTDDVIENAYIQGQDFIDEFIDRLSFVSYSVAFQEAQCISVAKEFATVGEKFDVIFTHYFKNRTLNGIAVDKLNFELDEQQKRYLRLLRSGILALSDEERLLRFFTVLDQVASEESQETIKNVCQKCGSENDTGNKKTNNYILSLLKKFGFSKSDVKKITSYRGKIAHGGGKRDQTYYLDVNKYAIMLEGPVYNLVVERVNSAKIQNDCNPQISGYPFIKSSFKYINHQKDFEYLGWDYKAKFSSSIIDAEQKNGMFIGVKLNENNQPYMPHEIEMPKLS